MAFEVNGTRFDESQEGPQVVLVSGSLPNVVQANLKALDFQEHGIVVEQHEPTAGGYVRHVTFVPYSNVSRIQQDYIVEEA